MRLGQTTKTYKPTETQKLVLLNISMREESQQPITREDATNVAQELLKQKLITRENLHGALDELIRAKLVVDNGDDTLSLTDAGKEEVEQSAQDDEIETKQKELASNQEQKNAPQPPGPDMGMGAGAAAEPNLSIPGMESWSLLRDLNDFMLLEKIRGK